MKLKVASLAAAGAIIGFLSFGGISLASAQDSSTTTTAPSATTDPGTADTHPADDPNCPNMGGDAPATAPAPTPSSSAASGA